MLKNKIYRYLSSEILKNFITILLTFAAIAWVVRAVNFLDLMVVDGYPSSVYFSYSVLNFPSIMSRFVPLAFLISLIISISKFERTKEFLILWTAGIKKISIVNSFFIVAVFVTFFQILLTLFVNPFLLNKSRSLLKNTELTQINSVLKANDFSDTFKGVTFYIEEKTSNNELINIFIKDTSGNLQTIASEGGKSKNSTIFAKKGFLYNKKLILFDGTIQTLNDENEIKNVQFKKTELSMVNFSTRTITQPKVQETSSKLLINCLLDQDFNQNIQNCSLTTEYKKEIVQNLSRRIGAPLYIPLISIIASFLIIYKKEKKYNYLKKYVVFFLAFAVLVFAEILLKYTGFSFTNTILYFVTPLVLLIIFYFLLIKNIVYEKITR